MGKELFDLGDDLSGRLVDFCEALRGTPKVRVAKDAIAEFIARELEANPGLRKRYDAERARRFREDGGKIRLLRDGNDERSK